MGDTYTSIVDPGNEQVEWVTAYESLNLWEDGEEGLYSSGDIAIADYRRSTSTKDTTAVSINDWTSGVIPKIIVHEDYRHEGKWADQRSDSNYVAVLDYSSTVAEAVYVAVDDTVIDGLCVERSSTSGYNAHAIGVGEANQAYGSGTILKNCITKYTGSGSTEYIGITLNTNTDDVIAYNCVSIAFRDNFKNKNDNKLYNCISYDGVRYGIQTGTWQGGIFKNCFSGSSGTADFFGTPNTSSDYNVSSDTTAPGTNTAKSKTSYTDYFVDPSNGDFHLKDTSYNLWGINSENLYATFTTDIDGDTRANSNQFGIGADYYVSGGGGSAALPIIMQNLNQLNGGLLCAQ